MILYIDIAAVATASSLIVGAAVGIGSFFYVRWRNAKHKLSEKLGIDENAGKEVEEDIVINDEDANASGDMSASAESETETPDENVEIADTDTNTETTLPEEESSAPEAKTHE